MWNWIALLISSLTFLTSLVAGQEQRFSHPHWRATCTLNKHRAVLLFDSKSGLSDEDDMNIVVQFDNKMMKLEAKPRLFDYFQKATMGLNKSSCDRLPAVKIGSHLLVFFITDSRPHLDQLSAILIDMSVGKILAFEPRLGAIYDFQIEPNSQGARVQLNQGWRKAGDSDGPDRLLSGWRQITVRGDKIESKWENSLPQTYSEY